jgi:hypothetical protein
MEVISVIEHEDVIGEILKHLGLWEVNPLPPAKATGQPRAPEYSTDYSTSHIPISDKCLYVDPEYPEALPS